MINLDQLLSPSVAIPAELVMIMNIKKYDITPNHDITSPGQRLTMTTQWQTKHDKKCLETLDLTLLSWPLEQSHQITSDQGKGSETKYSFMRNIWLYWVLKWTKISFVILFSLSVEKLEQFVLK